MPQSEIMEHLATLTDEQSAACIDEHRDHVMVDFDRRLVRAIRDFNAASAKAARWLLAATFALILLPVILIVLTIVLIVRG
jgi:hypothetical protein